MRHHGLMLLLLLGLTIAGCDVERAKRTSMPTPAGEGVPVVRVVDGDTIIVAIGGVEERLRYIGIDAPESVRPETPVECFGREASAENARLVEGKRVELEADISERDRFGRLLRYVYVIENGQRIFVNEALVANGFAHASTFPPDVRYEEEFRAAQREARDARRGLWSACVP